MPKKLDEDSRFYALLETLARHSISPGRVIIEVTERELGAWKGLLRTHAMLVKRLDAELEAAHGLALTTYEVLLNLSLNETLSRTIVTSLSILLALGMLLVGHWVAKGWDEPRPERRLVLILPNPSVFELPPWASSAPDRRCDRVIRRC